MTVTAEAASIHEGTTPNVDNPNYQCIACKKVLANKSNYHNQFRVYYGSSIIPKTGL
jgi:triosephosphate isomerase